MIKTLDNLFSVDDEYLEMAQEQEGAINKAVQAMESQLQNVQLSTNGSYRGVSDNIVVEVREVMPQELQRGGIGFGSFPTSSSEHDSDGEEPKEVEEMVIVLENAVALGSYKSSATALIVLPQEIIRQASIDLGILHYCFS